MCKQHVTFFLRRFRRAIKLVTFITFALTKRALNIVTNRAGLSNMPEGTMMPSKVLLGPTTILNSYNYFLLVRRRSHDDFCPMDQIPGWCREVQNFYVFNSRFIEERGTSLRLSSVELLDDYSSS
jgi:hypothetical protein